MSIMDEGRFTKPFESEKADGRKRLRIGQTVPPGAVNIAYMHTPALTAEAGVSLIDTAHINENIIPVSHRESLAIADEQGYLQYAEYIDKDQVIVKDPVKNFPSGDFYLTKDFYEDAIGLNSAMYHQIQINYHYDRIPSKANEDGKYTPVPYEGNQIDIVDLEGNSLLGKEELKVKLYVQGIFGYPNTYKVLLMLNKATTMTETICIKYNHLDAPHNAGEIVSVKNQVQLYVDQQNTLQVDGKTKHMLETGKIRILNPESGYSEKTKAEVIAERSKATPDKIYAVEERMDGKGYNIIVPDRTELDPRTSKHFQYMVLAEYRNKEGKLVKHATGLLEDSLLHPDVLLASERKFYTTGYKTIGLLNGQDVFNARDMIRSSLPITTPAVPDDAIYSIVDTKGDVLYSSVKTVVNEAAVDTLITEGFARAGGKNLNTTNWPLATKANTALKELPMAHRYSIIPERQRTKWGFEYQVKGSGEIEHTRSSKQSWKIRAHIGMTMTNEPKVVNINDHNYWEGFGKSTESSTSKDKWNMEGDAVYFNDNLVEMNGFWQKTEEGGRNLTELKDYEFSTQVQVKDQYDDDLIAVLFRVRDSDNFYCFIWERDDMLLNQSSHNGVGRLFLSEYGLRTFRQNNAGVTAGRYWALPEKNSAMFKQSGFADQHKQLFRVTKSSLPAASGADADIGWTEKKGTRYPEDTTGKKFESIAVENELFRSAEGRKGWKVGVKYKITIRVSGNAFSVYINENVSSPDPGTKVLEAYDDKNTHKNGSYGISVLSQTKTYWSNLQLTEYQSLTVDSDIYETEFKSDKKKLLIPKKVDLLMEPYLSALFGAGGTYAGKPFEVISYEGIPLGPMIMDVQSVSKNIYGIPNDGIAGSKYKVPWSTDETGQTVNGIGSVEYHSDGTFKIDFTPKILPELTLPKGVKNFKWDEPVVKSGGNVSMRRVGRSLRVTAVAPRIQLVGKIFTSEDFDIMRKDGMSVLDHIPNKDWRTLFGIHESVPASEVMLRIEKGRAYNSTTFNDVNHYVNYRFRVVQGSTVRYPVDQFQEELGMNRIRLKDIVNNRGEIKEDISLDTVAWTTHRNLKTIPIYAVKLKENRHLFAIPPRVQAGDQQHLAWQPSVYNGQVTRRLIMPKIKDPNNPPMLYKRYPPLVSYASTDDFQQELELVYSLPEYTRQEFYNKPAVLINAEQPKLLTKYSLQVKNQNIVTQRTNSVWAIRNHKRVNIRIRDIDKIKGIFYLLDPISEEDQIFVTYQYKDDYFEYRGFPMLQPKYTQVNRNKTLEINYAWHIEMQASYEKPATPPSITVSDFPNPICYSALDKNGNYSFEIIGEDEDQVAKWSVKEGTNVIASGSPPPGSKTTDWQDISMFIAKAEEESKKERKADIIFVIDVSGSMSGPIQYVANQLGRFAESLTAQEIDWRAGVTTYSDVYYGEPILKRPYRSPAEINQLRNDLEQLTVPSVGGGWGLMSGGDGPETPLEGIMDTTNGAFSFDFREGASKFFILLTDADYKTETYSAEQVANKMKAEGVVFYAIANTYTYPLYQLLTGPTDGELHDLQGLYGDTLTLKSIGDSIIEKAKLPDMTKTVEVEVVNARGLTTKKTVTLNFTDC